MASINIDIKDIRFAFSDVIKIIRAVQSNCFLVMYEFDDFETEMNLLNIPLSDD